MQKRDLVYSIMTYLSAALAVALGVLWMALAIKTFYSPEQFTQQGAWNSFLISLPVLIVFVLDVIVVGVYAVIRNCSIKDNVTVQEKDKYEAILNVIGKEREKEGVLAKEKKFRFYLLIGSIGLSVLGCGLPYLIYFIRYCLVSLDGAKPVTEQVMELLLHALPWVILALVIGCVSIYFRAASYKRSAQEAVKWVKDGKAPALVNKENKVALNVSRGVIIALAVTLIIVGAVNGEAESVLKKAAAICTECIGLG